MFKSCRTGLLVADELEDQMAMPEWLLRMTIFPAVVIVRTPDESISGLFLLAIQTTVCCGTFLNHIPA